MQPPRWYEFGRAVARGLSDNILHAEAARIKRLRHDTTARLRAEVNELDQDWHGSDRTRV